jgi:6-phosphogluconolactonase
VVADRTFYVGSYTPRRSDWACRGAGIHRCNLCMATGRVERIDSVSGLVNPSYLTLSARRDRLFAVQERSAADAPSVESFAVAADGSLEHRSSRTFCGGLPCHVDLHESGRWLAVAGYESGNVVIYPVDDDGCIGEAGHTVRHYGSSCHPVRQTQAHAHAAHFLPGGRAVLVPDLGLDELRLYEFDLVHGVLTLSSALHVSCGSGPRHVALHPSGLYGFLVNELASSVAVILLDGEFRLGREVRSLPPTFQGVSAAAAVRVAPAGGFVYASNRGHDSIVVFSFDAATRGLEPVQFAPQGSVPRDFAIEPTGRLLVTANQGSDSLSSSWLDPVSGRLQPTGYELSVPKPSCVMMGAATS